MEQNNQPIQVSQQRGQPVKGTTDSPTEKRFSLSCGWEEAEGWEGGEEEGAEL